MDPLRPFFQELHKLIGRYHPRLTPEQVIIVAKDGRKIRWTVPDELPEVSVADTRHSPDFRTVCWKGNQFTFTPTQAAVIERLWEAWEDGTPGLGQSALLESAGSETERLRDLFRGHPAMEKMIASKGKGIFGLND